jgi:ABC-type dipeptide/oligopeptide/nickel transport system ATPase component
VEPRFIVATSRSPLDVSIQAQIINLLTDLKEELTYPISSSPATSVVEHISDRVAVMYLGKVVEEASSELFGNPLHPTPRRCWLRCRRWNQERKKRQTLGGDVPTPLNPPGVLVPYAARGDGRLPEPGAGHHHAGAGHFVACHLYQIESEGPLNGSASSRLAEGGWQHRLMSKNGWQEDSRDRETMKNSN